MTANALKMSFFGKEISVKKEIIFKMNLKIVYLEIFHC